MNNMFTTTLITTAPLGTTEMYESKYKSNDNSVCNRDTSEHTPKVIILTILFGKF